MFPRDPATVAPHEISAPQPRRRRDSSGRGAGAGSKVGRTLSLARIKTAAPNTTSGLVVVLPLAVGPDVLGFAVDRHADRDVDDEEEPVALEDVEGPEEGDAGPLGEALGEVARRLDVRGPADVGVHGDARDEEEDGEELEDAVRAEGADPREAPVFSLARVG